MTGIRVVRMLALLAAVAAAACESSSVNAPTPPSQLPVATVEVTAPSATLLVGAQMTLVGTPKASNGTPLQRTVHWSSENLSVATVSSEGLVTAVAPGPVNIVAVSDGKTGVAPLVVTQAPPAAVAEVRLNVDDEVQLEWNGTAQLTAVPLDAQGRELTGRTVQWLVNKPNVATVSATGAVQAVGPGTAIISATIEGATSHVGLRVKQAPVTDVLLDVPAGANGLEVGETVFVGTRVKLASGQTIDAPMSWTSSNPSVATASSTAATAAAVEALGAGTVTLTATQEGKSASITLRVTPRPTHDLIYNTFDAQNKAEIFVLSLSGNGAAPVKLNAGNVSRDPSPSPDGSRFVFAVSQTDGLGQQQHDLYVVNRNGLNMRRLTSEPGMELEPAWSPDGNRIVFRAIDADGVEPSLWTVNVDGSGLKKITGSLPGGVTDPAHPSWSPDGSRIVFTAAHDFTQSVWTMNADGSSPRQVTTDNGFDITPAWSPDGSKIAFSRWNSAANVNGWDVMIVNAAGGTPVRITLPGDQFSPAWSPDGEYIAVTGTTAVTGQGTQNIYTLRPDGSGLRLRTVNAAWLGGSNPAWVTRQ